MINIKIKNGETIQVSENTKIEDITSYSKDAALVGGGIVDNEIKSLNYTFSKDANFEFIYLTSIYGEKIYERTLLFILIKAAREIFKEKEIIADFSLGGGIYIKFDDASVMTYSDIDNLKNKMLEIISKNIIIKKYKITKTESESILEHHITLTNVDLLEYIKSDVISIYELDGFYGYFYGKVFSRTGQITEFDLIKYSEGAVLMGIDPNKPDTVKQFTPQPKFFEEFSEYGRWAGDLGIKDIPDLNKKIKDNKIKNIILASEARHEYLISKMADNIVRSNGEKRIILIAGPSSSGKTTMSKRLQTHLVVRGMYPVTIALDDYFVDRTKTPLREDGTPDYESIDAIDIKLFNEHLIELISGNEVMIPKFDFMTGRRVPGHKLKVDSKHPIIIEGIHGLNEKLTKDVPKEQKYKIYISPLTVINIDQYNRIPTSDVRLIRRMVRDNEKRNKKAIETIEMWKDVRAGEEVNIFPYQEEADFVFNSALLYELPVLRQYAIPLLEKITNKEEYYYEAKRMLDFLSNFLPIEDEKDIASVSLLREFIGGSAYE